MIVCSTLFSILKLINRNNYEQLHNDLLEKSSFKIRNVFIESFAIILFMSIIMVFSKLGRVECPMDSLVYNASRQ